MLQVDPKMVADRPSTYLLTESTTDEAEANESITSSVLRPTTSATLVPMVSLVHAGINGHESVPPQAWAAGVWAAPALPSALRRSSFSSGAPDGGSECCARHVDNLSVRCCIASRT
jgi:hypothetical protein